MMDAKGCTIVPGFIDTHNHLGGTTLLYDFVGNPFEVEFVTVDYILGNYATRCSNAGRRLGGRRSLSTTPKSETVAS